MQAWKSFHNILQCFFIICLIDGGYSMREQEGSDEISHRGEFVLDTNSTKNETPMNLEESEKTTLSDPSSLAETQINLPLSTSNDLIDDIGFSSEKKFAELNEKVEGTSPAINQNEDIDVRKKLKKKSEDGKKIQDHDDAYNTIDTSGDDVESKDHGESTETITSYCHSVEVPATFEKTDQQSHNVKQINKNPQPSEETREPSVGESNKVTDLKFPEVTPHSFTVSWKRPNTTNELKYYLVKWSMSDKPEELSCRVDHGEAEVYKIEISSLTSCTMYTVKVTPYMDHGAGEERVASSVTGLYVTREELDLKILNKTTDSIKINWSMPGTNCVSKYVIETCHNGTCTESTDNATSFTKTELTPCWEYFFNLTVHGTSGPYGTTNITGKTETQEPEAPSNIETVPGNHMLNVSWTKPIGYTCAKYYQVSWSRKGVEKNKIINDTNSTSIELKDLEPCSIYEIKMKTFWKRNESESEENESEETSVQSNMTNPNVIEAPLLLEEPAVGKDKVSMKWLIRTNETNNCIPFRLIVACTVDKPLGEGYVPQNGSHEYHIEKGETNITWDTTIEGLSAYTKYKCCGTCLNTGGRSLERGKFKSIITLEDVPSSPKLLPALQSNVTNSSITLMWEKPKYLPGKLTNFTILSVWTYNFTRPPWCDDFVAADETILVDDGNARSYVYQTKPQSRYRIRIIAATGAGTGNTSESVEYFTNPGTPSSVTLLNHKLITDDVDSTILDVQITWGEPCYSNSKVVQSFFVTGLGRRQGFDDDKFNYNVPNNNQRCKNFTCNLLLEKLRAEYAYTIQIATKVEGYDDFGDVSELNFDFPAGVPPMPDENYTKLITLDPFKARRTTTTATLLLPIFSDTSGTIRCYAIIVAKQGYNNVTYGRLAKNSSQPYIASWIESKLEDFVIPYQAVKFCADSYPSFVTDYGRFKAVKFVLGEDTETCTELSSNRHERSYCNGPLKPDTWYHVTMRAFTNGGYRDSIIFTVKTNPELQVGVVIGTIFGILLLGILATMMLLVRKCSLQVVLRRFLHSDMPGSPVPAPFTRRKFLTHCQQLADNPGKLSNEYQLLQTLSVDLQMPTNAAGLQANRKKNRYTDILPYDFSRVKLEVIDNDPNSDYINASFIKGFTGEEDYIACQGPKEETTYDFWRMIDQYDVKIIVMLTQLVEKNKEKCHQYFPTIRETFTYENMSIRCTSEFDYRTYTDRTLVLQKENQKRTIIHLHFKDWPDHDVPEDFDPMINFCQIMRRHIEANRGLTVVHCSAGIGRTGTLIAIDILLQHIKDNRKLDVFGTVYRLRHHRINMVQRESQYAYIYNCIKQVLKNPYFSKNYKPPSVDPIFDTNSHRKKEDSDSGTNLVSSLETLKKSSFSTSVASAEPITETSSELTSRMCHPFAGLRYAKSTSAIDTRPYQELTDKSSLSHIVMHSTDMKNSDVSLEITESEGSTTSLYENMQPLLRSKSAHTFGREDDRCEIRDLLQDDTSL